MSCNSNTKSRLLLGVALLSLCAPGLAFAQSAELVLAAAAGSPADEVSDIVVTATRRETVLQDTPIAISVVGSETLEANNVSALLDIAGTLPSLRVSTFESRQSALTVGIRGIVPNDANQPAREQGVGIYLDGVYLGRQHGLNAAMLDLERVEVLRGPQGTLFGRNTEGGAVNMVIRRPSGELGVRATAGISNYSGHNFEMHADLPQFAGLSFKFDMASQYHDATTVNPMAGQVGWNYVDRHGYRAAVLWEPTDSFNALYAYDFGHSETSPFLSQLINYNPLGLPVSTVFPRPAGTISPLAPNVFVHPERQDRADIGVPQQPSIDEIFGHSLHLSWQINDDLELRSITAYREVAVEQYDNAGGPARPPVFQPNAPVGSTARNFSRYSLSDLSQLQRSQEFQLVGSALDGRLDYLAGLYYFNEKAWEEAATPSSLSYIGSSGDYVVRDPIVAGITRGYRSTDRGSVAWAESFGVYLHTVYTPPVLNDNLSITLGGRFTNDLKNGILYRVANAARNYTFELDESRFDPLVTLDYDITPDINVYVTYATGYRAGGANSRSLTYAPFESEEIESWEIGFKGHLLDRLTLNLAAYVMERTNSQIEFTLVAPDPVSGSNRNTVETVNAPGVTDIRGIELESVLRLTDNLRATFSYAYTETSVPDAQNPFPTSAACPSCGTVQPVFIIYTPRNAWSASVDYSYPLSFADIRFNINAAYADGTQSFEQSPQETDDSFIVNARLALADWTVGDGRDVTVAVWSRNLFNEEHIYRRSTEHRSGTNATGDYANFNEPRTYGIELSYAF